MVLCTGLVQAGLYLCDYTKVQYDGWHFQSAWCQSRSAPTCVMTQNATSCMDTGSATYPTQRCYDWTGVATYSNYVDDDFNYPCIAG